MSDKSDIFYELYEKLFYSDLKLSKKKIILRSLFTGENWSWRVVGISKKTFELCKQNDFKKVSKKFERHHFIPFAETAKIMFENSLLTKVQWWKKIDENEKTHLICKDEHKKGSSYRFFEIKDENLFANKNIGWEHGLEEQRFLRGIDQTRIDWKTNTIQ